MLQILFPSYAEWPLLWKRPNKQADGLEQTIKAVFDNVKSEGDTAVLKYTRKYDWATADVLKVAPEQIAEARSAVPVSLQDAITLATRNIETFHNSQKEIPESIETMPGVSCWRECRPIERVGIYIPSGTAPLFSTVLMLAIPARIAGCKEIILCTPPDQSGKIDPAILYTAALTGVMSIFCVGGIQAIAAMSLGTESIPKVDKLFGPGNQYVTAAKTYAQRYGMCIDLPAGPSEVLVIADETATPAFVAADLLSQAEHGVDSQSILVSNSKNLVVETIIQLEYQLPQLPRRDIATEAIKNSKAIVLENMRDCVAFSNGYAPEHLIIACDKATSLAADVTNAGSVFLGHYSCESVGDYASGTNHTLPTNGYARSYSGVSLDSFVKKITFQNITEEGLKNIGPATELMAEAEGLAAHKEAVSIRLRKKKQQKLFHY